MEKVLSKIQRPEIIKARLTLERVCRHIDNKPFMIVGSYAREVASPEISSFDVLSDIDFALRKEDTLAVAEKLLASGYFNRLVRTQDYNSWHKRHDSDIVEYRVVGDNMTPVHLVGSLSSQAEASSVIIDGLRYSINSDNY